MMMMMAMIQLHVLLYRRFIFVETKLELIELIASRWQIKPLKKHRASEPTELEPYLYRYGHICLACCSYG